ncbi:MAG TPA: HlyD family efflux transporter periplasmic adaptor subunit [Polyangia bacterium]|nr:HlyD family efflux transporter periplasmic adaptor subunit [Polyangia bacterium]
MAMTPKIRSELNATPVEADGIKYFDISDPKSGGRMRLYDFEWLVAAKMDGARRFDEVATWAQDALGIHPTAEDLAEFARRLRDLGFFQIDADFKDDVTPLPQPVPSAMASSAGEDVEVNVEAEPEPSPALKLAPSPAMDDGPTLPQGRPAMPDSPPPAPLPRAVTPPTARLGSPPSSSTDRLPAAPDEPPRKSGGGSMIVLLVLLLLGGGGLAYFKFLAPPQSQKVTVQVVSPREVVTLYDGAGTVTQGNAQALSFGEAGKVVDVVAKGTAVTAGQAVASLEAFGKIEKDLADVKDRLGFYEKQLTAAKAKGDDAKTKEAEAKVNEKKTLLATLEARAAKVRLVAASSGTVTDVMVTQGGDAKAGAPAIKIADNRLTVSFKLKPDEIGAIKPGSPMTMQPAAGGATIAGRFTRADGDSAVVELLDDATTVKAGDQLRLVKAKVPNVVPVPLSALVKRDGADTVFVLSDGEAKAHKVTVVDRTSGEALISSGLAAGDSVITSGTDSLQDGQKATTN